MRRPPVRREDRALAIAAMSRAPLVDAPITLKASSGGVLSTAARDELLKKCMDGEYVELELEVKAFEQEAGKANRNFVRHRDGGLVALGRSGKGTPFLRDHRQGDSLARAGTVVASQTEKLAEGHYVIRQTVKLTASWAVELALRGLLSTVSIGWNPIGPVMCSACNAEIFSKCYHFPGDKLREVDLGEAGKKLKRDSTGDITVEWIFSESELVETSIVPVPAVPSAHIEDVRAALSASHPSLRSMLEREGSFSEDEILEENEDMNPELLKLLGLSATATMEEVLAAIAALSADRSELSITKKELAVFQADIDKLNADKRKSAEDTFIADALSSGRITKGDEPAWREFHQLSAERAVKRMGERPAGLSTPVGQPRASAQPDPEKPSGAPATIITGGGTSKAMAGLLAQLAVNPRAAAFAAHAFGYPGDGRTPIPTTLGATSIANNADLDAARIGFHAAFLHSLEQSTPDELAQLYTQVPSNKPVEQWNWLGDLPGLEEWDGDRKLAGQKGYKLRVENKKWANGLRVKNDDFKDDALGLLGPQVAGLAVKARRHRFDLMMKLLINGFAGNAYPEVGNGIGYDGAFFFSDAGHEGGNDNKMTAALDSAGLVAAQLQLESMTTYDGNDPLDIHGTHLIVGPKLRNTATKLLTQEYLASGESNPHRGMYQLLVTNRLRGTYDDYWFLADLSQPIKPFLFQMREEISTSAIIGGQGTQNDSVPRFQNDELWFGAEARYNVGYFEHRLIVGSVVA